MRRLAALAVVASAALPACGAGGDDPAPAAADTTVETVADPGTRASFSTDLTGAAEVPGPGDPDGSGQAMVSLSPGSGEVCLALTLQGVEPTGVLLQEAPAGESGPVVLALPLPAEGADGCASADEQLLVRLEKDPTRFYVNVHSAELPDGAVRGQLG